MKGALLVLVAIAAIAHASVISTKPQRKLADAEFLKKQHKVLTLFHGIENEPEYFKTEYENFDYDNKDYYTKPEIVEKFVKVYKRGFLAYDGVFTLNCHKTRYETLKLFKLFYFAKDFETFYKVASWARKHIHPQQFAYAYIVAIYHREDTQGIVVPPLYEIFPHYYVNSEVISEVYRTNMLGIKQYKFDFNATGYEYGSHPDMFLGVDARGAKWSNDMEHRISYFREDVGLNNFYANWFLKFPSWMDSAKYSSVDFYRLGELFYFLHRQIYARYALERISNAMYTVDIFDYDHPMVGYNPNMVDYHGRYFIPRADGMTLRDYNPYGTWQIENVERRVYDAISSGYLYEYSNRTYMHLDEVDGIEYLGRTMYGTKDGISRSFYGSYFFYFLQAIGDIVKSANDHEYTSGVTGHIMTTLRDPAYYYFLHRMVKIFDSHKYSLKPYSEKDLYFQGVKVDGFEVDKLVTYFDKFDFEVTNGVPFTDVKQMKDYKYVARQMRLNHKPFTYKINVQSDKNQDAMVRIFLGPKYDAHGHILSFEQSRNGFVQVDMFPVKLTSGQNVLERHSHEAFGYTDDQEGFRSFYDRVKTSMETDQPFYYSETTKCGAPQRLILPRGWKSGIKYQMYVIVTPYTSNESTHFNTPCGYYKVHDGKAMGFPFDRMVYEHEFEYPNMYFKDVVIYHKDEYEVNRAV